MKKIVYLCVLLLTTHCLGDTKLAVVTSIKPIDALVSRVMLGVNKPYLILSDQQSPHHTSLKPSQITALQTADLIFIVDPKFEGFLDKALAQLKPNTQVISLAHAKDVLRLPLRRDLNWQTDHDHDHDHDLNFDGHIWLDPNNAIAMTQAIIDVLSTKDPTNKNIYINNGRSLISEIQKLDNDISMSLEPVKKIPFLVFHDGYQYFEHRYGLNGRGAIVFEPNDPLKATRLKSIESMIQDQGIKCVFQDAPGNPRVISLIKKTFKISTATLDPLGIEIPTGPNLYLDLLSKMSSTFKTCLSNHN